MNQTVSELLIDPPEFLRETFELQQAAFAAAPMPSLQERRKHLLALRQLLVSNREALAEVVDHDYNGRSRNETLIAEIAPCLLHIDYTLKHLGTWLKPQRRNPGLLFLPARARVIFQPLGVVGIISPFNYPVYLAVMPLITAIAAGNRAMLKLSEATPRTANLLHELLGKTFKADLVSVIRGDAETGAAFAQLPFDHLLFTGSTAIGRKIMQAAANNLTPVTLELGGKSPAIIADDISMSLVAERLCFAKSLTAGQTCIAPDYVLLPRNRMNEFIEEFGTVFRKMYPAIEGNADYTGIIHQHAYQRLQSWLQDAAEKGAQIIRIGESKNADGKLRMPMHLVCNVNENMQIMQHELFGPVLPLLPYDSIDAAIHYVNSHPRPLALYLFSNEKSLQHRITFGTHAGSMCFNEALLQIGVDDMPFGGIGPSGMGQYHGHEGFLTFSATKSILQKGRLNSARLLYPPYGTKIQKWLMRWLFR